MPFARAVPLVGLVMLAVVATMTIAARAGNVAASGAAAAVVPIIVLVAALAMNRPFWNLEAKRVTAEAAPVAARRNAALFTLAYAWGAVTLLTVYPMAGLRWYHWWQYGGLMLMVAALLATYTWSLGRRDSPFRTGPRQLMMLRLVTVQGMLAAGGVGWLLLSGKAASEKGDWAANHVFLAGGIALVALSAIAAVTQKRLGTVGR